MTNTLPVYLDCNATTPLDPRVREVMLHYFDVDYGNEGSRTHEYGTRAKRAVHQAREQVAALVKCDTDEVIFTSGATESNNLALLGLAAEGEKTGRRHIISTRIEHKAVLEPLHELERRGFTVDLLPPNAGGWVEPEKVAKTLRPDTLLVTVMHANNETGVLQPIAEIADLLKDHPVYFHTDAAQTFGKVIGELQSKRVDLISVSGHKIYGPKGVGALIVRRRGYDRVPLAPLMFGGGQERGLRPGTLPVPLIAALGKAADLAGKEWKQRAAKCLAFRKDLLVALGPFKPTIHGDSNRTLPHVLNVSFPGIDSEALMVALKHEVAISNGSACTSATHTLSHVLEAMELPKYMSETAVRLSWSYLSFEPDPSVVLPRLAAVLETFLARSSARSQSLP
jgi:cysteine desulfurase